MLAKAIVGTFLQVPQPTATNAIEDGIYMYALEVFSLGMVWHAFHDAIREGDGKQIMCYWKFLDDCVSCYKPKELCKRSCHFAPAALQKDRQHSFNGHSLLTLVAKQAETFHVTCTWNTSTDG
jgi:hypothetical protein